MCIRDSVDADFDGILDNATVTCDGMLIVQQQVDNNQNGTQENTSLENITTIEAVDEGEQTIGISILLIAGIMFLLLIVVIGMGVIMGSKEE